MNNVNQDFSDSRLNTNAPFAWYCKCSVGGYTFTGGDIVACQVMMPAGKQPPVNLSGIAKTSDGCRIEFSSKGVVIAHADISSFDSGSAPCFGLITAFIYNENGILSGHMTMTSDAALKFLQTVTYNDSVATETGDFVLLPECCVPTLYAGTRVFEFNGTPITANLILSTGKQVETTGAYSGSELSITVNAFGADVEDSDNTGIVRLTVFNPVTQQYEVFDTKGKHLVIKAGFTSNLRVVDTTTGITLKGVKDA